MQDQGELRLQVRRTNHGGALVPFDALSAQELRQRRCRDGTILIAQIRQARNPDYHRFAHALAHLLAEHVPAFQGMQAHAVLKHLQMESGIGCEQRLVESQALFDYLLGQLEDWLGRRWTTLIRRVCQRRGIPPCVPITQPRSLSFENMDQAEFEAIFRALCRYVVEHYWPQITEQELLSILEHHGADIAA